MILTKIYEYNVITKETTFVEIPDEPTIEIPPPEPTLEERVTATETNVVTIQEAIDVIFGGV